MPKQNRTKVMITDFDKCHGGNESDDVIESTGGRRCSPEGYTGRFFEEQTFELRPEV